MKMKLGSSGLGWPVEGMSLMETGILLTNNEPKKHQKSMDFTHILLNAFACFFLEIKKFKN